MMTDTHYRPAIQAPHLPDSRSPDSRSIAIVGGGASGVLMAVHLLRAAPSGLDITIVEKGQLLGRGLAYSTDRSEHLLNVRASNMSAFADDPDHFVRWLAQRGVAVADAATYFAPRRLYGAYLEDLLSEHRDSGSLRIVQQECVDLDSADDGVTLRFADGSILQSDLCILATGHQPERCTSNIAVSNPAEPVLILGTGLSMVDACLSLALGGHKGPIIAVSRRGLVPQVHRKTAPLSLARTDIPLGRPLLQLMRWVRALVRTTEAQGGGWRDVVDGLRPHTQEIWRRLPENSRRQFLRHAKAWWDIHRHRLAPQVDQQFTAIGQTQLEVIAGRLLDLSGEPGNFVARLRRRGQKDQQLIRVGQVIDCSGVISDPEVGSNPLVRSLLTAGVARCDALRISLDVSAGCAVLDRSGRSHQRLYAIGPLTRGAFLEIEAVPDIRAQCQQMAASLLSAAIATTVAV